MSEIRSWPKQIKALHEAGNSLKDIIQLVSMYPLANQTRYFEDAGVEWTEQERETLGIGAVDQEWEEDDMMGEWNPQVSARERPMQLDESKWANQEDPMEAPDREGTHAPTRILASRQYLDNYADPDSKVIQYETQWTDSEGNVLSTWSTEETIRKHIPEHNPTGNRRWEELVGEWEDTKQGERTKREPVNEILAGKPSSEQRYWRGVTHLAITTGETNPDQDIKHTLDTTDRQLRTEGDTTYCYEPNGGLIGTLSTAKVRELYDRYAKEVGDGAVQRPTGEQLAKRLKLKLEHKIHVGTFEEEIAQLLIRYSSKAEMKHRKRNLQNHWTLPPEMMEAVQEATGARTEVFASPLNVHKNTKTYYSQYPRDSVFGAAGSAWEAQWEQLGAYQFNPEYTAEDLHRALKKAINATKTAEPVLGVGIYPTYAKSPYRKLLNKHAGYRVHELLEVKEGQFTFLPPDHWMQGNLQTPKQCNWNMRILVVANAAGWRKFCPNALESHIEETIDSWLEDRGREGEHMGGDRGPRPSTMDVLGANTTWSREEISRDALRRWALQFTNPDADEGDIEGDQWLQWERGEVEEAEPQSESQWDNNGKGDILWKIMKQIQKLNGEGTKVALYKVKAHVGIHGNEKADEVARKACVEGEYGLNHDNTDTEGDRSTPQPTGEEEGMPMQKEDREVKEEEMRLIQEEEMTPAREEQQGQSANQSQTEPDQERREMGMPLHNVEEPQDAQQHVAPQVTQETGLPETRNINMETQQEEKDELVAMAQQQEEAQEELWQTREKMDRGGKNQQFVKEFEARRLSQQVETMNAAKHQWSKRRDRTSANPLALQGVTLAQLLEHPCDAPELGPPDACYLPWEHLEQMEDGSMAIVTELKDREESRPVRILVLFSGTGSVEKGFTHCFPEATVVTLDQDPRWQPTHLSTIEDWDPTQYPLGSLMLYCMG
eukprot:gene34198-biopygen19718